MKSEFVKYWYKIGTTVLLVLMVSLIAKAQQDELKPIEHWAFDSSLIPARSIYGLSWDPRNVDSPRFDAERVSWGILLNLVEDDCEYVHPIKGKVNSQFGWRRGRPHKGIDLDLEIGDPVCAAFDGVVRIQRYNPGGFGNYVLIRHYNGLETLYAHLSEAVVVRNQTVRAGDTIGFGGNTGRSTGPHLHFETRLMGQAFDPRKIIDFDSCILKEEQAYINKTWFPFYRPPSTASATSKRTYHKIRRGDTLYGISKRYGVSINQICRLNGMSRRTTLRIGRTLRIR